MDTPPDPNAAVVARPNDRRSHELSRRELLTRASALGAIALSSAATAEAEITSQAVYAKAGPYGGATLPPECTRVWWPTSMA